MNVYGYNLTLRKSVKIRTQAVLSTAYQLAPFLSHRRFQAYCIGLPRSGTHSISNMFSANYSSQHEARPQDTIIHILRYLKGDYSDRKLKSILRARDKVLRLEMEASHYLHFVCNILATIFPDAKFIFTVRDPYSWLNSEIRQNVLTQPFPLWRALENYRYGRYSSEFSEEEKALENLENVSPIGSYLKYWRDHYRKVVDTVPKSRLLLLKTGDIKSSVDNLAQFLSIPSETIDLSLSHSGRNEEEGLELYSELPYQFVKDNVEEYCGDIMKELFPEFIEI